MTLYQTPTFRKEESGGTCLFTLPVPMINLGQPLTLRCQKLSKMSDHKGQATKCKSQCHLTGQFICLTIKEKMWIDENTEVPL